MNTNLKLIPRGRALLRSPASFVAGMLLGLFLVTSLAATSFFTLSRNRLDHVARNALDGGELAYASHTDEDYFTECSMLIMLHLRHDRLLLDLIETRFIHPAGHPCEDLQTLVSPSQSSQVTPNTYSYVSYPLGSRYLEAFVLSFIELRTAKTFYALLSYGSVTILFWGAWHHSPKRFWAVLWVGLYLLMGFSMHRFGHNLAHAPGFFIGFGALGFFVAAREQFRDPAKRFFFFGLLGIIVAFFDLLHGSIPVVLSLSIVLNHLFYVSPETPLDDNTTPFAYLALAVRQALMIFACFLAAYLMLTGLRIFLLGQVIDGSWPQYLSMLKPRLGKTVSDNVVINLRDVVQQLWITRFQLTPGGVVPATWMLFLSLAAWIFTLFLLPLAIWRLWKSVVILLTDLLVLVAAAAGVLSWYYLFPQHTYIHVLFIVRIVALPASLGLVAATILVRFVARRSRVRFRWALIAGCAGLALVTTACLLEGAWGVGMAPFLRMAHFLDRPEADKVSCSPRGLTPDGKKDGVIEILLTYPRIRSPLTLLGFRPRREGPAYLLLERSGPLGFWETGPSSYVLGISSQAEGELINQADGSIILPAGHTSKLWAYFCRDEADTPASFYSLRAGDTTLQVTGHP